MDSDDDQIELRKIKKPVLNPRTEIDHRMDAYPASLSEKIATGDATETPYKHNNENISEYLEKIVLYAKDLSIELQWSR